MAEIKNQKNVKEKDILDRIAAEREEIVDPGVLAAVKSVLSDNMELQRKVQEIKDKKSHRELREEYSAKIFSIVKGCLIGVFVLAVLSALNWEYSNYKLMFRFDLDKYTVISLSASFAVGVLSLFGIVIKGLFK